MECSSTSFLAAEQKTMALNAAVHGFCPWHKETQPWHEELGHGTKNYAVAQCNMLQNAAAGCFLLRHKETMARNDVQCYSTSFLDETKRTMPHNAMALPSLAMAQRMTSQHVTQHHGML